MRNSILFQLILLQHFQVPKFLDAIDIDVEKPDEKSVMMYVAEIIKVAEARSETAGALGKIEVHEIMIADLLIKSPG